MTGGAVRGAATVAALVLAVAGIGLAALHLGARLGCRAAACGAAAPLDALRLWTVWLPASAWVAGKVLLAPWFGLRVASALAVGGVALALIVSPGPSPAVDVAAFAVWVPAALLAVRVRVRRAGPEAAPLLVGLLGVAALAGLGLWQLDRLAWKEALVARIEGRVADAPGPVPAALDPAEDLYRAVAVEGRVAGEGFAVFGTWRAFGAGVRVIVPVEAADGDRVLVDLGAIPWEAGTRPALAATRAPPVGAPLAVRGHLDWPDAGRSAAEADGDEWLVRDVEAMAARSDARPVLVVAEAVEPATAFTPLPVGTEGIANNHLGYAVQWFGLAAVWAGMTLYLAWRIRRRTT